jgi:hypothetical protein
MAKLYFYYASMNAGKSTNLLQAAFNYHERGMATMLWTAAVDDRAEHLGPDGRLPAAWACMPMPIALVRRPTCGRR